MGTQIKMEGMFKEAEVDIAATDVGGKIEASGNEYLFNSLS